MIHKAVLAALIAVAVVTACSKGNCHKKHLAYRTEEIKAEILSQLQMTAPPDASKMPSPELREEYERMFENMQHSEKKEKEVFLVPATDPSGGGDLSQLIASFDVKDVLHHKELLEAKLSIQINGPEQFSDVEVHVYHKSADGDMGEPVASRKFALSGKERVSIEIPTDVVEEWKSSKIPGGLFVDAKVNGHNVAVHPQETSDDFENMILQLTVAKGGVKRRGASPVCTDDEKTEGCCLYDLRINFKKIGWDWIVAPKVFNAYICRGDCHLNSHHYSLNENGHTKIMKLAHRMNSQTKAELENVGFCCHASEYDFLQVVYVNREGNITSARVKGMVAQRCACS